MAVHIEAQENEEVMQIRSRELQLENTERLDQMVPIVETIGEVNLQQLESNTQDIKDMVTTNLDEQVDLNDLMESMNKLVKGITELKKSNTRLQNSVKDLEARIVELGENKND